MMKFVHSFLLYSYDNTECVKDKGVLLTLLSTTCKSAVDLIKEFDIINMKLLSEEVVRCNFIDNLLKRERLCHWRFT